MLPYLVFCVERAEELNLLLELGASRLLLLDPGFHVTDLYFQRLRILLASARQQTGFRSSIDQSGGSESHVKNTKGRRLDS